MASGDLGPLNETAQGMRVMKEKYIQWQARLNALIAQVSPPKAPLMQSAHK